MMFFRLALAVFVLGCGSDGNEDQDVDQAQRTSMRSEIEGTWSGKHTFKDGRAPTSVTLTIQYRGSGQSKPLCGERVLSSGASFTVSPQCVTIYTLPLDSALVMADGSHRGDAISLRYTNLEGLTGTVGDEPVTARLQDGRLEGSFSGATAGTFTLTRN